MSHFPSIYEEFIYKSRYSRWIDSEKRRENWEETVERYMSFMKSHLQETCDYKIPVKLYKELSEAILNLEVMPSMRALMTAGPALDRCNVAGFNCSYIPLEHPRCFDELLYILMCGTGVGFSVERQYINRLPEVNEHFEPSETTIIVADTKAGWARALRELLSMLWAGQVPKWDVSRLRPKGSRLKTFGGRSSGPDPLVDLFRFCCNMFQEAAGRKMTSIECHDLACKIGDVVVSGGVRRSALISLSNLTDERMRNAKSGQWWERTPYRALANNSVCYTEKPDIGIFMREWSALYDSKSGERGIFNRVAAKNQAAKNGRRDTDVEFGTNPCSEIILRPYQFCNLTEAVVREKEPQSSLTRKVKLATILGTYQATLTEFKYLRGIWKRNTEEERLLGVSLTGMADNISATTETLMEHLKRTAIQTNASVAKTLGIPQATAVTCVKPSGTVSQLVNSSSGMHTRYAPYYIRTVRCDKTDPVAQFMVESGVPHEDCVNKPEHTVVFSFPIKSPEHAYYEQPALDQLEIWKTIQNVWTEHKPSVTITVAEDEWMEVGAWVYKHFDAVSGVSFLPKTDHIYQQAPYQEITKEEYTERMKAMPKELDWTQLSNYEEEDNTVSSQTLACTGNVCEVVDLGDV